MTDSQSAHVLLIEPFYGGSHRQLIDLLQGELDRCDLFTLPAKKWHWRSRTSALYFSEAIPSNHCYMVLFCSSVLNLAELAALRPDLAKLRKVVYFHENQLIYPVRKQQDRDFQYGYNQILTCLVADVVIFNSSFNKESFLTKISNFLKLIPDHRPVGLENQIRPKCIVLYFPIVFPHHLLQEHNGGSTPLASKREQNTDTTVLSQTRLNNPSDSELNLEIQPCAKTIIDLNVKSVEIQTVEGLVSDSHHSEKESKAMYSSFAHSDQMVSAITSPVSSTKQQQCSMSETSHKDVVSVSNCDECDAVRQTKKPCLSMTTSVGTIPSTDRSLVIVWPHRWEHDKDPELLFRTLYALHEEGCRFKLAVIGETYTDVPGVFAEAASRLKDHIICWGYQSSKANYYKVLQQADVVISTSKHEFFGVAMLEATYLGCYPLVPNDLVYPEIFPKECLYNTEKQLLKRLKQLCRRPQLIRNSQLQMDLTKYSWQKLKTAYIDLLSLVQCEDSGNIVEHITYSEMDI